MRNLERYVAEQISDYFGTEGQIDAVNTFSAEGNLFDSFVLVNGDVVSAGSVTAALDMQCVDGNFASQTACGNGGLVDCLQGLSLNAALASIQSDRRGRESKTSRPASKEFQNDLETALYAEQQTRQRRR